MGFSGIISRPIKRLEARQCLAPPGGDRQDRTQVSAMSTGGEPLRFGGPKAGGRKAADFEEREVYAFLGVRPGRRDGWKHPLNIPP